MGVRARWDGPESTCDKYGRLIPGELYQVDEADLASLPFSEAQVSKSQAQPKQELSKQEKEVKVSE